MSAEKINQKKTAIIQKEADFAAINIGMQDRIQLDGKLGKMTSKEKDPKAGKKELIGPN